MLQTEFETLTGIYPDSELYKEIEKEYMDGDWPDKQAFCAAYKKNKDGLAEKIQRRTSEKLWKQDEKHRKAMAESSKRIEELYTMCNGLQCRLDEAEKQLEVRANALVMTTMTNEEIARFMLEGVDKNLKNHCSFVADGFMTKEHLDMIQKLTAQRAELLAVLEDMH